MKLSIVRALLSQAQAQAHGGRQLRGPLRLLALAYSDEAVLVGHQHGGRVGCAGNNLAK